jgi:hypothetical protein
MLDRLIRIVVFFDCCMVKNLRLSDSWFVRNVR